jgi:tetratricopeptide (TPR) repeat protein
MPAKGIQKKIKTPAPAPKAPVRIAKEGFSSASSLILGAICLLVIFVFAPCLKNGFAWDDVAYVQNNALIRSFDMKAIFTAYVAGNYHPLTILVHAVEYHMFGLHEEGYHATNLFIHLCNTLMVCMLVYLLSRKKEVALVAALLFGVHPVHVESVAWISELKDLLYTFFYLLALICYTKYVDAGKKLLYVLSVLFFAASLLSKAMAASLPVLLICIDFFRRRKFSVAVVVEKLPFFALAVWLGIVAIYAQQSESALHAESYPFPQPLFFAASGILSYIFNWLLPLQLTAYYPYPVKPGESIPFIYYVYLFMVLAATGGILYSLRRTRKIFFGFGFFAITIFLVLKFLPVGFAMMADRYMYIPSIGLSYLAGEAFYFFWQKKNMPGVRPIAISVLIGIATFYSVQTMSQNRVWKDNFTLWSDVITKNPTVGIAYLNRGTYLTDHEKYPEALADLTHATELLPDYANAFFNRGVIYKQMNRSREAILDYSKAIALNPEFPQAYVNRGILLRDNQPDTALTDFNKAVSLDPNLPEAYNNRGILYLNKNMDDKAQEDFNKAIELKPDYSNAYVNRGNAWRNEKKFSEAEQDYNKAIALSPDLAIAWYNRGVNSFYAGDKNNACRYFQQAASRGYALANDAFKQAGCQ